MEAAGTDERSLIAALMALTCIDDGRFHEVRDYRTRQVKGSSRQLWTAAAFLGVFDLGVTDGDFLLRDGEAPGWRS